MANVPCLCLVNLEHCVFENQEKPKASESPSPQVEVIISLNLNVICCGGNYPCSPLGARETLGFDLDLLTANNPATASQILRGLVHKIVHSIHLQTHQIFLDENSAEFDPLIHGIVQFCLDRMKTTNVERVLPVFATAWGTVLVQNMDGGVNQEEDSYEISQEDDDVEDIDSDDEIFDQFEEISSNNHGMVPADESSINNMLLNNKVIIISPQLEEISDHQQDCCVVCLEQLAEVGSEVSQMPCSHQFHTACIQTWLNNSHYCPVCRYAMPTAQDLN
ncbi:Zinc finger, RING-type [Corchorus olitorius]|uniref:RING-type E3 ubiquitin transferase n=1 Tax=Corchorus olitorius TaxID=93759 RepID=A0A1R3HBH6_9ROSI|nr:Zinc finger, RING-type [Corchorus olitorius]